MSKKNAAKTTTKAPKKAKAKTQAETPAKESPVETPVAPAPDEAKPESPADTQAETSNEPVPDGAAPEAPAKKARKATTSKPKKVSALDAAHQVLVAKGEPMTAPELIEAMATAGLWESPGGKTPAATLYAAMLREITTKGNESRFSRPERGKFASIKA